jgi:4-hydroxy-tetrahydrodipicolinate reductase
MGQALQGCIAESADLKVAGVWIRSSGDASRLLSCDLASVLVPANIAIDFTLPAATDQVIAAALSAKLPLVCGVSGLSATSHQRMAIAAENIPILYARNMSMGIAVMQRAVQLAAAALGDRFDAEIHESHHVHKLDAPSGTALQLGEALATGRGQKFRDVYHYETDRATVPGDIHFEVLRQGKIRGEHTVQFKSDFEIFSLTHKVTDRRVFAAGAVRAARWLLTKEPGLYSLEDLFLA